MESLLGTTRRPAVPRIAGGEGVQQSGRPGQNRSDRTLPVAKLHGTEKPAEHRRLNLMRLVEREQNGTTILLQPYPALDPNPRFSIHPPTRSHETIPAGEWSTRPRRARSDRPCLDLGAQHGVISRVLRGVVPPGVREHAGRTQCDVDAVVHVAVNPQRRLVPRDEWLEIRRERRVQDAAVEPRRDGARRRRVVGDDHRTRPMPSAQQHRNRSLSEACSRKKTHRGPPSRIVVLTSPARPASAAAGISTPGSAPAAPTPRCRRSSSPSPPRARCRRRRPC